MMDLPATRRACIPLTRHIIEASMFYRQDVGKCVTQVDVDSHPPGNRWAGSGALAQATPTRDAVGFTASRQELRFPGAALHSKRGPGGTPFELLKKLLLPARRTTQADGPSLVTPRIRRELATSPGAAHRAPVSALASPPPRRLPPAPAPRTRRN